VELRSDRGGEPFLSFAVVAEDLGGPIVDRDLAGLVALGVFLDELAGLEACDGVADPQHASVEVDRRPSQSADLAASGAGGGEESERHVVLGVAALGRRTEERVHDGRSWGGPRLSGDRRRCRETDDVPVGPPPLHCLLECPAEN
jgi:hypothetical protein